MSVAWIAGATGLTGRHCLATLLESPRYTTIAALTRRPLEVKHGRLIEAPPDGTGAPVPADVFCAIGTTIKKAGSKEAFRDVDQRLVLRIAANARGAAQFLLVSSAGAHAPGANFYLQVKRETEDELQEFGFQSVHIFRPSLLLGERSERRRGESLGIGLARAFEWSLAGGLRKYRPIEAGAVARAMVAAAALSIKGRHIYHYDEILALGGR